MFDNHFSFINSDTNAIIAANITAKSNEKLGEKLESISKEEIKSKDRVDISLEEYLNMRKRIEELESQNSRMSDLIKRIGIPFEEINKIVPDSVTVYHNIDPMRFTKRYRVAFNVEDFR